MPSISLIGHVERCPQNDERDEAEKTKFFSLNLSVALSGEDLPESGEALADLVIRHLRPWAWAPPTPGGPLGVSVAFLPRDGGDPVLVDDADVTVFAPELSEAARDAWFIELERRLEGVLADGAVPRAFRWPPSAEAAEGEPTAHAYSGEGADALRESRRWFAEMLEYSREPAPLPHQARLTLLFTVPASAIPDGARVTAAPHFRFSADGPLLRPARTPGDDAVDPAPASFRPVDGSPPRVQWGYQADEGGIPDPPVTAFVNLVADAEAVASGEGPWPEGWARLAGALYREDWLGELEWRAADLFDLPALLLRYIGSRGGEGEAGEEREKSREETAAVLAPLVRATLRDLVQTGATCRTRAYPGAPRRAEALSPVLLDDYGLAADLLRELARVENAYEEGAPHARFRQGGDEILRLLERWETSGSAPDLAAWWDEVLLRVGRAAPPPAAAVPMEGGAAAAPTLATASVFDELRALHAYVSDEERARELVLEQWNLLLGNATLPDPTEEEPARQRSVWPPARRDRARQLALPALGVRKRLALQHLGVQWSEIVSGLSSRDRGTLSLALRNALAAALAKYANDRAGRKEGTLAFLDLPRLTPSDDGETPLSRELDAFATWLGRDYLPEVVEKELLAGGEDPEHIEEVSPRPDALVLHVADVAGEDPEGIGTNDPLRGIAGFGLLLRRGGEPAEAAKEPVFCPTLADLFLRGAEGAENGLGTPLALGAVIPVRVMVRNGVRRALVSYNNEPVCAESPAGGLSANHQLNDAAALNLSGRVRYVNPYGAGKRPRLLGLRFGQAYDAAAFVVGVGGNLPRAACEPGDPTRLRLDPVALSAAEVGWTPFTYTRRVAVGPLRFQSPGERSRRKGLGDELDVPPVPPSVHPLARSLYPLLDNGEAPATPEEVAGRAEELRTSLILLVPPVGSRQRAEWRRDAQTEFRFEIRPPSVDLQVWDRSFDFVTDAAPADPGKRTPGQRRDVWMESFAQTRDNPVAAAGRDDTLDDPPVTAVFARLTPLFPPHATKVPPLLVAFSRREGRGGLSGERSRAVGCRIRSVERAKPTALFEAEGSDAIEVEIPEGQVWLLELFSALEIASQRAAVQERLWELFEGTVFDGHVLVSPRRLVIEVATGEMPEPEHLHQALRVRAVAGGPLGRIREPWPDAVLVEGARAGAEALRPAWRTEVALDPTQLAPDSSASFRWLHRVDVLVQRWRWNGRPLRDDPAGPHPESAGDTGAALPPDQRPLSPAALFAAWAAGDDAQLAVWDGRLFGDRAEFDYRLHEATVDFGDPGGLEAGAHRVFHHDVSLDPGALYFRYAVRAESRYAGLMERPVTRESRRQGGGNVPEAWRRLVVPCRHDREIPPPRVKLVLPLTDVRQAADGTSPEVTPGLLVVLNEPWFRYGGLAEELVAEIDTAREPDSEKPVARLLEIGPDPLVAARAGHVVVPPGDPFPRTHTVRELPVHGPIGYTFDTDTLAPEFVHTAFVVAAPGLEPAAGAEEAADGGAGEEEGPRRDLSWHFLKLRFRRRLEPSGFAVAPSISESEATGPLWAQFLPPSSVFAVEGGDSVMKVADLAFLSRRQGAEVQWFLARDGRQVPLLPTTVSGPGEERFQLWALVTQPLFNAYGRPEDERFLDFCPVDGGVLRPKNPVWTGATGQPRRVRLVEVQVLPGQGAALRSEDLDDVREFFFPYRAGGENLREARARVVRVSQALDAHPLS